MRSRKEGQNLSTQEMSLLEKAFEQAKANMELEGFTITKEDEKYIKAVLRGEKTIQQLISEFSGKE